MSSQSSAALTGAHRAGLIAALASAARDDTTYLRMLPKLGPLQMVDQFVRGGLFRAGALPSQLRLHTTIAAVPQTQRVRYTGLAIANQDRLVLCDAWNSQLKIMTAAGDVLNTLDLSGRDRGSAVKLTFPQALAVDTANNHIWLTDYVNARLHVITVDGRHVLTRPTQPLPWGICANSLDEVFVATDRGLMAFSAQGDEMHSFDTTISRLSGASSLAVTAEDDILVGSSHNVCRLSRSGKSIDMIPTSAEAVCCDLTGAVVVGYKHWAAAPPYRIYRCGQGGWEADVAFGNSSEVGRISGSAINAHGQLFIADREQQRVQVWGAA